MKNCLVVLSGPTASGKTDLAIRLAKKLGAEILSADSRQIFKELNIGVAKPTPEQLRTIPHHFIGSHSVFENVNAGLFETLALEKLNTLFLKNKFAILAGGSGLYIKAVCEGLDAVPPSEPEIRQNIIKKYEELGISGILTELKSCDENYFHTVDQSNPHRIIRALEVFRISGKPFSSYRKSIPAKRNFKIIKTGLELEKNILREKIDLRVDKMMEDGLLEEVSELFPHRHLNALQTVGYRELFEFLEGKITLEDAVKKIKQNTKQYAKRQMTWFKKDKEITWFGSYQVEEILNFIEGKNR